MVKVELEFYTMEEREPPFNTDLLCKLVRGGFLILTYHDDNEYGKCFCGYENYWEIVMIESWADIDISGK